MRHTAVLTAILICILPFSKPIISYPSSAAVAFFAQDSFTLEGKITEKTANKLTLSGGDNVIFHVIYNDKTAIKKKDGSPATAQDLHVGLSIAVAGDLAESGEITAQKIDIEG